MVILMLLGMSGGRYDDRTWPPPGTEFEVPDWEGEGLVRVGHAQFVRASDTPPAQSALKQDWVDYAVSQGEDPGEAEEMTKAELIEGAAAGPDLKTILQAAAGPVIPQELAEDTEAVPVPGLAPDPAPEPDVKASPAPSDPKADWIDYAVSQGAKRDTATAMTKADLMSRYGGRL